MTAETKHCVGPFSIRSVEGGESDDSKKKKKLELFRESKLELVFAGHSIGHYSALVAAEAMGFEDGFRLIIRVFGTVGVIGRRRLAHVWVETKG